MGNRLMDLRPVRGAALRSSIDEWLRETATASEWTTRPHLPRPSISSEWGAEAKSEVRPNFSEVQRALDEANWILAIDEGAPAGGAVYLKETLKRSAIFLEELVCFAWLRHQAVVRPPSITPAEAGSIDLFWQWVDRTMLINIPASSEELLTFYGEDGQGESTGGTINEPSRRSDIVAWLVGA